MNIYTIDCETDPFKKGRFPKPFIWGIYDGVAFKYFYNTKEFVEYASQLEGIAYAHNGGKFDWHFILDEIEPYSDIMVISGRLAKFQLGSLECRDSMNIFPLGLAKYQKTEIDYSKFESKVRRRHMKEIISYLFDDCRDLYQLVTSFIERYGLNLTLASTAVKQWRKIENEKSITNFKRSFYDDFADFYYGGRVECFHGGIITFDFKVIDINSAYPDAMQHEHCWGHDFSITTEIPKSDDEIRNSFFHIKAASAGAFPYRGKKGLDFPNDYEEREFFVTGWEILAARKTNTLHIYEIIAVYTFKERKSFGKYVNHFFNEKAAAKMANDNAGYQFAKLFLNSLYGKFAANPEKYSEHLLVEPEYVDIYSEAYGYLQGEKIGDYVLMSRELSPEKHFYYNVATAASITGFVRAKLWESICAADTVLYCDTDSIACRDTGNIKIGEKLGEWDVEAECNYGAIAGKKLYAFRKNDGEWKKASKGAKLSAEEIVRVARGETVTYEAEAPTYSISRAPTFLRRDIVKRV